jgi:hypothetical protein
MIRMRRIDMAPPRGWIISPPLVPSAMQLWSFYSAVKEVRRAHPEYSEAEAAAKVDAENALRCLKIGADNFVIVDETPPYRSPLVKKKPAVRPHIPVTLLAVDTSAKAYLAELAIERCLEQATFDDVKLLTTDTSLRHAVRINPIDNLEAYSRFCIREMVEHVQTSHVLVVQWDGYVLRGEAWSPDFLKYDYIGPPWLPSRHVGNGGFSLRSKRLLNTLLTIPGPEHPEDAFICNQHRPRLAQAGIQFAPYPVAAQFGFEGRSWNGAGHEWEGVPLGWSAQFGFHSFLTPLPEQSARPRIYHHSGDLGDAIYGLAVMKNLGGGVLFISADNRFPYPANTRMRATPEWVANFGSLANQQDYVWRTQWTHALPFSTDFDLNQFRRFYQNPQGRYSLFDLHQRQFGACHPEAEPWLMVDRPNPVAPIVVNRTNRYRNDAFPWRDLVTRYGGEMVFVGTEDEHHAFNAESGAPAIPRHHTANLLELARAIAGAKVYIGNQSVGMAIAFGLGQNLIQEKWPGSPDCVLDRANAAYFPESNPLDIAAKWLAGDVVWLKSSPFVTFIIPTIGRPMLARTLQSLLDQTDPDWKAVVIADAVQGFELPLQDPRIVIMRTRSKLGASHFSGLVRNRGITLADSEWIGCVDDDDRLDASYVERLRQEGREQDLVVFRMRYSPPREDGVAVLPRSNRVEDLRPAEVGISFAVRSAFRRQHDLWFTSGEFEDWLFIERCLGSGAKCKISDTVAYYVRH